jgi:hypothetical protein
MKRILSRSWMMVVLLLAVGLWESVAQALVSDDNYASPPDGWPNLCSGSNIEVKPTPTSRSYTGTGACWVNVAHNKADGNQQDWVRSTVTLEGVYAIKSSTFIEKLTFVIHSPTENASVLVTTSGACPEDPWATGGQCTSAPPSVNVQSSFGWATRPPSGPLSRNVFGSSLIAALISKQLSKPPLAPVDLDAVRWPDADGKGSVGRVFWRAPDVSGNKFILSYDIEYAMNSSDSAFSKAGQVTGPGAKSNLSPSEVSHFFYTPFKLGGAEYYFRVCSVNDAGRQCTAPHPTREPTKAELIGQAPHHQALVKLPGSSGGSPPGPTPAASVKAPVRAALPAGPVAPGPPTVRRTP